MREMILDYEEELIRLRVCRDELVRQIGLELTGKRRRRLQKRLRLVEGMIASTSLALHNMRMDEAGIACR